MSGTEVSQEGSNQCLTTYHPVLWFLQLLYIRQKGLHQNKCITCTPLQARTPTCPFGLNAPPPGPPPPLATGGVGAKG